jgi:hypothetical protein
MSRALAHRLIKLARQACACDLPTWAEIDAAMERLRPAARAYVDAVLPGQDPPERDETQIHADSTMQIHGSVSPLTAHQPWSGTWRDRRRGRLVGGMLTTRPDHA